MSEQVFTVYIIEDNESVRNGFHRLMDAFELKSSVYATPEQFFADVNPGSRGCILFDISSPSISQEIRHRLCGMGGSLPLIAISGLHDEKVRQLTMQLGAKFFMHKPVDNQALLDAIAWVSDVSYDDMRDRAVAR